MNNSQGFAYTQDGTRLHQYQRAILARLPLVAREVAHFDELLQWLGEALVQYFHIQVTQFWIGHQHGPTRQLYLELRMMVFQNPHLSQEVVVNTSIAGTIERMILERRGIMPQSVNLFFPQPQTDLLKQHNLSYWSCYFLNHNALVPPTKRQGNASQIQVPLSMEVALFFQEMPNSRLIPIISAILEQAVIAAKQQQLLKQTSL